MQLNRHDHVLLMLQTGEDLYVHVKTRQPGLCVPDTCTQRKGAIFVIGLNCATPIPDLMLDDKGISATLSFDRIPIRVWLPWESIWAVSFAKNSACGVLFEANPDAVVEESAPPVPRKSVAKTKGHLRLVK